MGKEWCCKMRCKHADDSGERILVLRDARGSRHLTDDSGDGFSVLLVTVLRLGIFELTPPVRIEISGIEIYEKRSFLAIAARIGNAGFEFKTYYRREESTRRILSRVEIYADGSRA